MLRNKLFTPLFLASLILTGAAAAFGQTATVGGRVELKKADGTTVPVANAKVDCYRSDADLKCRSTETNSRGEFTFLGIPYAGRVILAVSGPGISPVVYPGVKAGREDIVIQVNEGEGPALTEEEVRTQEALFLSNPTGELTEDQKKAQEEYEKKLAEVKARNEKIEKKNQIIERTLKEGNDAYNSGNYDLAIAKYEEGIEADPDFVGSAPVLLNNRGAALKKRAVEVYNTAAKGKDQAQIAAAKVKAAADLVQSLDSYGKSFEILKNAKPEEIIDQNNYKAAKINAADGGRDAVRIMVLLKSVDGSKNAEAKELTEAYITNEADKKKQAEAQSNMAAYLFEGGDYNGSVVEYRKAYEMSPKDPDVLAKYSLALYTVAEANQDPAMKQESLNVMEVYLSAAPKDHSLRADIAGLADYLKNTEKMKPQKMN